MMKNSKIISWGFFVSLIIGTACAVTYKIDNERISKLGSFSDYEQAPKEYVIVVDSATKQDNFVQVDGCVLKLGTNSDYVNNRFILIDAQENVFGLNTIMVKRSSATEFFHDGFNYDNSGLSARGKVLALDKGTYTIGAIIIEKDGHTYIMKSDKRLDV